MILPALFLLASLTGEQQARAAAIYDEIRCVVCQNQSIAESEAELARVMRRVIDQRIEAGDTDEEVISYLTARYGDAVLLRPRASGANLFLWAGPVMALLAGGVLAFSLFRRGASGPKGA